MNFIALSMELNFISLEEMAARNGVLETLPPSNRNPRLMLYEWEADLEGHFLSSRRNRTLQKDSESNSTSATYFCGQTLTFRLETERQLEGRDVKGIWAEHRMSKTLYRSIELCAITNSVIFVSEKEMTNQFPVQLLLTKGFDRAVIYDIGN